MMPPHRRSHSLAGLGLALALALLIAPGSAQAGRIQLGGVRIVPTNPDPIYDVFLNLDIPAGSKLDPGDIITVTNAPGIESLATTKAITPPSDSPLFLTVAQGFKSDPTPGEFDAQLVYFGSGIDNSNSSSSFTLSNNNVGYESTTTRTFTVAQLTEPIYWFSRDATGTITDSGFVTPTLVPEPGAFLLLGTAVPALLWARARSHSRRRRDQTLTFA